MPGIFPSESHTCVNLTHWKCLKKCWLKRFFYLINLALKISGANHGRFEPDEMLKQNPLPLLVTAVLHLDWLFPKDEMCAYATFGTPNSSIYLYTFFHFYFEMIPSQQHVYTEKLSWFTDLCI